MSVKPTFVVLFVLCVTSVTNAQTWNQTRKVITSDREVSDYFGRSASISGNYAVVGATLEDEDAAGTNTMAAAGSVYVFERDSATGTWAQTQKIVASDRDAGDRFGHAVDISGNYIIVGVPSESEDTSGASTLSNAGSAYVFERDSVTGTWSQTQKIVASDRDVDDKFGHSVSVSGNYIVVGAYQESENALGGNTMPEAGSAYIYERNGSGIWVEVQKVVASDRAEDNYFGEDVAIDDGYTIIGAFRESHNAVGADSLRRAGAAYIFERNGGGVWVEVQKIVASDRGETDYFGEVVSISGSYAIVGASSESEDVFGGSTLSNSGSAYIFERNGSGTWVEVQKIVASDRAALDYFGEAVDIYDNYAVVGAEYESEDSAGANTMSEAGSAYIFERDGGGNWNQVQKIVPADRASQDHFGRSVSISGDYVIIGAPDEDEDLLGSNTLSSAGSAYVFNRAIGSGIPFFGEDGVSGIQLYPNPTRDMLKVNLRSTFAQSFITVAILNVAGQVVYKQTLFYPQQSVEIDTRFLNRGMYILHLKSDSEIFTAKIIKE